MKRNALAGLLIAAMAVPAAAEHEIPVCPPSWMAELLRSYSITFACAIEQDGAPPDEGVRPHPRTEPMELPSVPVPLNRVLPDVRRSLTLWTYPSYADGDGGREAHRVRWLSEPMRDGAPKRTSIMRNEPVADDDRSQAFREFKTSSATDRP